MVDAELITRVLEQLPEGVIVVDADGKIVFVNKSAEKIRHISAEDRVGKHIFMCHPPNSQKSVDRALQYLQKEDTKTFVRMITDHENGKYYENTYNPIRDENNKYIGSMVISRDITDSRQLEMARSNNLKEMEEKVSELKEKLSQMFISLIFSLINTLEAKDPYTKGHSMRVCGLASKMAEYKWGLSPIKDQVELAAQLHDIGKIGIREEVLHKADKLSVDEYNHIKTHTIIAGNILASAEKFKPTISIIRHHHERFDGQGYPDGLKGEAIPEGSRILAIADTYDAMTSDRPYRKALSCEEAAEEIKKNLGSQFCPEFGNLFLDLFYSGTIC